MTWSNRNGNKNISRNVLANGNLSGNPRGYKSHTVASLVGYDAVTGQASQCIMHGMNKGYIGKNAKVVGIEKDKKSWNGIEAHAKQNNLNFKLFRGDFKEFAPQHKFDLFIVDLMCLAQPWVGEKLVEDIVPMLSSRRSGLGINVNAQHVATNQMYTDNLREYERDKYFWDTIFDTTPVNPDTDQLQQGVCNRHALASFIGVHKYMRHTNLIYRGCYWYAEKSPTRQGVQYMLSLRYETEK